MSKRIFTKEQIEILLQNQNVSGCSDKSISYRDNLKILAVKKYQEGLPASEIFRQAKFDIDMIGRKTPKECLRRWRKIFGEKGETGLKIDGRGKHKSGGRPKNIKNLTDKEKMKRLWKKMVSTLFFALRFHFYHLFILTLSNLQSTRRFLAENKKAPQGVLFLSEMD